MNKQHTGFYPEPIFRGIHGGSYMLMRDVYYVSELLPEPLWMSRGFVFSPSIPTFVRMLVPVNSQVVVASLPHDFIYQVQPEGVTQKMADELAKEILVKRGEDKLVYMRFYIALRLFGWIAWEGNKIDHRSS